MSNLVQTKTEQIRDTEQIRQEIKLVEQDRDQVLDELVKNFRVAQENGLSYDGSSVPKTRRAYDEKLKALRAELAKAERE